MFLNIAVFAALAVGSTISALMPRNFTLNDCAHAVAGSNATAFMVSARADCSSNVVSYTVITVLVTPTPSVFTQTNSILETVLSTTIATSTGNTTHTVEIPFTQTDQQFSTAYQTSTELLTLTVPITITLPAETTTITVPFTSTPITTITSYYPTATAVGAAIAVKRDLVEQLLPLESQDDGDEDDVCEVTVEEVWVVDEPETTSTMDVKLTVSVYVNATSTASVSSSNSNSSISFTPTKPAVPVYVNATSTASALNSSTTVYSNSSSSISFTPTFSSPSIPITPTSTIPVYASACTSWAEYVTACSSAGISQITSLISLTLPADTVTVFVESTQTTTLLETLSAVVYQTFTTFQTIGTSTTQTSIVTLPVEATSIQTVYQTSTMAASPVYVTQTVTVLAATPSVSSIPAAIRTFKLQMVPTTGGTTLYMTNPSAGLAYSTTTDPSLAPIFTIDTLNRLVTTSTIPQIACAYTSLVQYYMESVSSTYLASRAQYFTPLSCTINSDATLTCTYKTSSYFTLYAANQDWFYSTAGYQGFVTYTANVIWQ